MSDTIELSEYEQGKIVQEVVEIRRRTWFRWLKRGHVLIGGRILGTEIIQPGDVFTEVWDVVDPKEKRQLLLKNRREVRLSVIEIWAKHRPRRSRDPESILYLSMMLAGEGAELLNRSSMLIGVPGSAPRKLGWFTVPSQTGTKTEGRARDNMPPVEFYRKAFFFTSQPEARHLAEVERFWDEKFRETLSPFDKYMFALGLFTFGQLDAVEHILDNFPEGFHNAQGGAEVIWYLLPIPRQLHPVDPTHHKAIRAWLRENRDRLTWDEEGGKFVFRNSA